MNLDFLMMKWKEISLYFLSKHIIYINGGIGTSTEKGGHTVLDDQWEEVRDRGEDICVDL